ncbi:hypothetical protein [Allorhodopirellula heiligendammensis]|uniref:Uncharacterized protein n=1 Tax=Allorhodopirellula heiligendammensis TaxID=2714739 RepID=A0A5C6C7F0_9BACT|nr:hypothetical protein [Allorhodopirellula heiligendammensis]TWU20025.1 hypothetical protein Poly21_22050 [Allorhodopirellula heiligendammensis]
MNTSGDDKTAASNWLVHQWIVAGIVSASARFIPIPFVDDAVRSQCRRFVVSRTLSSHQPAIPIDRLKPYYSDGEGCLQGCLGMALKAPIKLLLFPIRKIASVLTSIHSVPIEVLRLVLLGRTLDRYLSAGRLSGDPLQSAQMRRAFEGAFARMDFRVVRAGMADALSSVRGWKTAATGLAKKLAGRRSVESEELESPPEVEQGAQEIQVFLDRPDTLALFAEFDRRFDELMSAESR